MNEGQEKSPFSDSLATEENGLGFENLNQRLQRYAGAKSRALDMADYIKTEEVSNNENRKLVKKLGDCASYLVFKHYYTENKVILHGMKTCRQQLLCPFCALRRAAKHVKAYWDKVATVKAENPDLQLYFVTLTVKDGESLQERFNHLVKAERSYKRQRRNALAGQRFVEYAKAQGAFAPLSSNEAKLWPMASTHAHDLAMLRSSRRSSALKGMGSPYR